MNKTEYHIAMAQAENHFSNIAEKMEVEELNFICEQEPQMPIIDALITAKQIVQNRLKKQLDSILEPKEKNEKINYE